MILVPDIFNDSPGPGGGGGGGSAYNVPPTSTPPAPFIPMASDTTPYRPALPFRLLPAGQLPTTQVPRPIGETFCPPGYEYGPDGCTMRNMTPPTPASTPPVPMPMLPPMLPTTPVTVSLTDTGTDPALMKIVDLYQSAFGGGSGGGGGGGYAVQAVPADAVTNPDQGASGGSALKPILILAGLGGAAYLGYRYWKKRQGAK